jgi:hypothetical protein
VLFMSYAFRQPGSSYCSLSTASHGIVVFEDTVRLVDKGVRSEGTGLRIERFLGEAPAEPF